MPCGGVAACTAASKLVKIKFNRSIKFNLSKIKKGELYFKSGKEILPGDYVVIDNNDTKIYKQDEFVRKFRVVYDMRDRIGSFYSID